MKKGQIAPRGVTRGLRQRAWWVMCRRGVFTLPELLATLATGAERDAESNLRKYLKVMTLVGILVVDAARVPGASNMSNGHLRYRLRINNGRKAPVWRQRYRQVFDPNDGTAYDIPEESGNE